MKASASKDETEAETVGEIRQTGNIGRPLVIDDLAVIQ